MLASMRRRQILEHLQQTGGMRLSELSRALSVSEMTIRRDLEFLQQQGLVERVHGGAVLRQRGTEEPGFAKKALLHQAEKEAIARRAAQLIQPGCAVALSAGTTTWHLARLLATRHDITVVTNSMSAWSEFRQVDNPDLTVILTGGEYLTPSNALVGPTAEAAIRSLYFDILFLGVHGLDPVAGLTTPNISEAETNRVFISRSRRLVVLADHTKWRTASLCTMADLSRIDTLITDSGLNEEAKKQLRNVVGELLIVSPDLPSAIHDNK